MDLGLHGRRALITGGSRGILTSAGDGDFTATFALNAGHAAELIRAGLPHLLSARASWITGANIAVDGGQIYPSARRFD